MRTSHRTPNWCGVRASRCGVNHTGAEQWCGCEALRTVRRKVAAARAHAKSSGVRALEADRHLAPAAVHPRIGGHVTDCVLRADLRGDAIVESSQIVDRA